MNRDSPTAWPLTISLPLGLTVGGLTTWALQLGNLMARTGRRVRLVSHEPYISGHVELDPSVLNLHNAVEIVRAPSVRAPEAWQTIVQLYRRQLPTVLMPNVIAESYTLAASLAATHADELRVIGWNHSDDAYDYACLNYYEPAIHRFVVNTRKCESELQRRIPTRAAHLSFVEHGVVPVPCEHDCKGRPIRIAYCGRMDQLVKRVLDIPKLATELDKIGVAFDIKMVGDGPQSMEIDREVESIQRRFRNPRNSIARQPSIVPSKITEIWTWADVSLLPSSHEGLSVAMLEAMAAGCVPVVSRIESGAMDVIRDGENGFTFEVGNIIAIASHIDYLSKNSDRLTQMSTNARTTTSQRFGIDEYIEKFCNLVNELEAQPPRPWPLDRSLMMSAPSSGHATILSQVPSNAIPLARRRLNELAARGHKRILIYGAGGHTRALAEAWAEAPLQIHGFVDDDTGRQGQSLWGWPIISPNQISTTGVSAILVSSWMYEKQLMQKCLETESNIEIAGLYTDSFRPYYASESQGKPQKTKENLDAVITVLVWDAFEAVTRLLESLSRSVANQASCRLLILDQGSERPTAEALRTFAEACDTWVSLDHISANIGYPAGHNRLYRSADNLFDFRYWITINSDVVFHDAEWLDELVRFMDARPDVGIAGPTGVIYDRTPARLGWCRTSTSSETEAGKFDSISGSVCIIRRSMIAEIGLFDECFTPGYYEDTDLAFRAKAAGWKLAFCPVNHGHHDLGLEKSTAQIKRQELSAKYGNFQKRNRDLFVHRWLNNQKVNPDSIQTDSDKLIAI